MRRLLALLPIVVAACADATAPTPTTGPSFLPADTATAPRPGVICTIYIDWTTRRYWEVCYPVGGQ